MNRSITPGLPRRASQAAAPKPVFVDHSGRRRRLVAVSGVAAAVVVVLALGMLVAGLFGASPVPLPGLPELGRPALSPEAPQPLLAPTTTQEPAATAGPAVTTGPAVTLEPTTTLSSTTDPTSPRHIPTQTPTDRGKSPKP